MDTQRLRQKILDLAIRGKLVEQNPDDEPASVLLERIYAEKLAMVKRGELKPKDVKNDSVIYVGDDNLHYEKVGNGEPVCIEDEIPFELPEGWEWCRFGTFAEGFFTGPFGSALHKSDYITGGIPVVNPADIQNGNISINASVSPDTIRKLARYRLQPGDFIIGRRGEMGRCAIIKANQDGWLCGTGCFFAHLPKNIAHSFFAIYCRSSFAVGFLEEHAIGTTMKNLNREIVGSMLLPVPSLAEQQRIVAALDERLNLVDRIEREEAELDELVAKAKAKVLDLAIRGKLVEQDPDDEPASALLERIHAEKLAMVERGELPASAVKADTVIFRGDDNSYYERDNSNRTRIVEGVFAIPNDWAWTRLGVISNYGESESATPDEISDTAWVLDLEDIEKGTGRIIEFVTKEQRPFNSTKHAFAEGQLLYSKLRPYLNKVLVAPKQGFCTAEILPICLNGGILPAYVRICMMSPYFLSYANQLSYGVKMPRLGTKDGRRALIPLPSLTEQARIVSAVDEAVSALEILLTT